MKTVALLWLCVARLYRQVLVNMHARHSQLCVDLPSENGNMGDLSINTTSVQFSWCRWWFTLVVHLLGSSVIFQLGTGGQPVALGSRSVARLERAHATLDAPRCASPRPSLGGGWRRCQEPRGYPIACSDTFKENKQQTPSSPLIMVLVFSCAVSHVALGQPHLQLSSTSWLCYFTNCSNCYPCTPL